MHYQRTLALSPSSRKGGLDMLRICMICSLVLLSSWSPAVDGSRQAGLQPGAGKVVILMIDGFGMDYYRASDMPCLQDMEKRGLFKVTSSLMPSVTNVNNTSICTGEWPSVHGITGNSYFNPANQTEECMEEDSLVQAPTVFERAAGQGVASMLFSSKKKTISLLSRGTREAISPETASKTWVERIGPVPDIYSREVNYWLMEAAIYSIQHDPGIGLFYNHTTDYPMHTWPPDSPASKEHLRRLDSYISRIRSLLPGARLLITADHSVHHKSLCWDLEKACANRGIPVRMALSPERDKYFKHHRGFGGSSYVYLMQQADTLRVSRLLRGLPGVDEVITRRQAEARFHLQAQRIGDLMVLGDSLTVFGELDQERESLPYSYRSHGSLYETEVPLFIFPKKGAPPQTYFYFNYQIARWLYPGPLPSWGHSSS